MQIDHTRRHKQAVCVNDLCRLRVPDRFAYRGDTTGTKRNVRGHVDTLCRVQHSTVANDEIVHNLLPDGWESLFRLRWHFYGWTFRIGKTIPEPSTPPIRVEST